MKTVSQASPPAGADLGWFDRNRSSIVIMLASTAVALLKLAVGWHVGSLAVLADATLALAAGARSAYLIAFADAMEQDDDPRRRLSRERASLAAVFGLGLLLALTGWDLFGAAVVRLVEGEEGRGVSLPVLAVLS
ncbi:MAG: cation transporter, partial [Verrucomicrobiia bacterium]